MVASSVAVDEAVASPTQSPQRYRSRCWRRPGSIASRGPADCCQLLWVVAVVGRGIGSVRVARHPLLRLARVPAAPCASAFERVC